MLLSSISQKSYICTLSLKEEMVKLRPGKQLIAEILYIKLKIHGKTLCYLV